MANLSRARAVTLAFVVAIALQGCTDPRLVAEWGSAQARPIHSIEATGALTLSGTVAFDGNHDATVKLYVRHERSDTVRIATGPCLGVLRGYRDTSRREPAVWNGDTDGNWLCPDVQHEYQIPPRESLTLERSWRGDYFASRPSLAAKEFGLVVVLNDQLTLIPLVTQ